MNVDQIINDVIAAEKGYVNNPNDTGGETNFGITVAVARQNGYAGNMRDMPRDFAVRVYRKQYIEAPGFNLILAINEAVAAEVIDTGVNMGPGVAGKFLQRALNVLQEDERLTVDGVCGPATRRALQAFLKRRPDDGAPVLVKALNCLQGCRYIELVEGRDKNRAFIFGWLRARVNI